MISDASSSSDWQKACQNAIDFSRTLWPISGVHHFLLMENAEYERNGELRKNQWFHSERTIFNKARSSGDDEPNCGRRCIFVVYICMQEQPDHQRVLADVLDRMLVIEHCLRRVQKLEEAHLCIFKKQTRYDGCCRVSESIIHRR